MACEKHKNLKKHTCKKSENKPVCQLHKHEEGFHDEVVEQPGRPLNPDNEDNRSDDCEYCKHLDAVENADGTAGMHDNCPACKEYDESDQTTGGIETDDCPYCKEDNHNGDGCPLCQEYDSQTIEQAHPEKEVDHICNCPNCPKHDATALEVEDVGEQKPSDNCPECSKMYGDAIENQQAQTGQEDPNMQGHQTAEEILDLLDQEPGKGTPPEEEAEKIDNTEMPQGDAMLDNVSVKENFGDAQKNDISDADKEFQEQTECNCPDCPGHEDEPDYASVLQDGLEEHANEQKKQEVLNMVGQALSGFKANKQHLEATREQSPELYSSCIDMLRSMIELCKLLGLEPKAQPQENRDSIATPQENRDSIATPPPAQQAAAPQEVAAQDPKAKPAVAK